MLIQCQSEDQWVNAIETQLDQFSDDHIQVLLPAGETPKPLYKKWRKAFPQKYRNFQFIQVDEVLDSQNLFKNFFLEELPGHQVHQLYEVDINPQVAILGLGLNGHVGFHEPFVSPDFFSGCVQLCDDTVQRLDLKPQTWGVTFGVSAFRHCQKILLLVRGQGKQLVLEKVLGEDLTLPASHLVAHPGFCVVNLRGSR